VRELFRRNPDAIVGDAKYGVAVLALRRENDRVLVEGCG
jgi:hypothetical protein